MIRFGLALMFGCVVAAPLHGQQRATSTTFVIVHGAWGGSWDWRGVDSLLTARGHTVHRVALTGLGERAHLGAAHITLDTHITDVVNHIEWDNLRDVVLVGHSYGGMVITGAADRMPERIRTLIYVDAMLPDSGDTVLGIMPAAFVTVVRANIKAGMIEPGWNRPDEPLPRDVAQPLKTFTDTLHLSGRARRVPATYILTYEPGVQPDMFQSFADRALQRGWRVHRLLANHVPQRTAPRALVELILQSR